MLSGWATSYAIDDESRSLLRACLTRGVRVYIGYGYKKKNDSKPAAGYEIEANNSLKKLQEWCAEERLDGRLHIFYFPNHAKTLIVDDKYAINGSFNWLSNKGSSQNEERSWIIYDWDFVTSERDKIIGNLDNPLEPSRRGLLKRVIPWSSY